MRHGTSHGRRCPLSGRVRLPASPHPRPRPLRPRPPCADVSARHGVQAAPQRSQRRRGRARGRQSLPRGRWPQSTSPVRCPRPAAPGGHGQSRIIWRGQGRHRCRRGSATAQGATSDIAASGEVVAEEGVETRVVDAGEVYRLHDAFALVYGQLRAVVANPLEPDRRILVNATVLLEEPLDLWQRVEASRGTRPDDTSYGHARRSSRRHEEQQVHV